jgi:hypothetical protein
MPLFTNWPSEKFTGKVVCRLGTIEYDGDVGKPTRLVISASYEAAKDILAYATGAMTPPNRKPQKRRKRNR